MKTAPARPQYTPRRTAASSRACRPRSVYLWSSASRPDEYESRVGLAILQNNRHELPEVAKSAIINEVDLLMTILTGHVLRALSAREMADAHDPRNLDSELDSDVNHLT